jgi:hypothetical protein
MKTTPLLRGATSLALAARSLTLTVSLPVAFLHGKES